MKEKNDNLKAKSPLFRLQELVESFESTFHSDAVYVCAIFSFHTPGQMDKSQWKTEDPTAHGFA